jgi:hypothetical protein
MGKKFKLPNREGRGRRNGPSYIQRRKLGLHDGPVFLVGTGYLFNLDAKQLQMHAEGLCRVQITATRNKHLEGT